jgi:rfaE bifunctional protein nucleotidyltransferase chain/domain
MDTREKILSRTGLHEVLEEHRRAGRRIVFALGVFDVLSAGDVRYLAAARAEGDRLVVAVLSDAGARRLRAGARPVLTERARAILVAALAAVDYVILADEADITPLLREFQPDVYACRREEHSSDGACDEMPGIGIRVALIDLPSADFGAATARVQGTNG